MAGNFFIRLALWQKMTLVLACAIAVTIGLGYGKLFYNRHRLRKYEGLAHELPTSPEKAAAVPLTDDIESNAGSPVPFGIRAIQSGIEIDGVWVSPCSTPTRNLSKDSLVSPLLRPQIQSSVSEPTLLHPGSAGSSLRSSTMTSTASRSASSDRSDSTKRPRGSPASSLQSTAPHQHYRRLTHERSQLRPQSEQGSLLDKIGQHPVKEGSKQPERMESRHVDLEGGTLDYPTIHEGQDWQGNTRRVRVSKNPNARVFTTNKKPRKDLSISTGDDGDLGMLDRHRLSHVASTGQLGRRTSPPSEEQQRTGVNSKLTVKEGYLYQSLEPTVAATQCGTLSNESSKADYQETPNLSTVCNGTQNTRGYETSPVLATEVTNAELSPLSAPEMPKRPTVFRRVNSGFEVGRQGIVNNAEPKEFELSDDGNETSLKSRFSMKSLPRKLQKKQRYDSLKGRASSSTKDG